VGARGRQRQKNNSPKRAVFSGVASAISKILAEDLSTSGAWRGKVRKIGEWFWGFSFSFSYGE